MKAGYLSMSLAVMISVQGGCAANMVSFGFPPDYECPRIASDYGSTSNPDGSTRPAGQSFHNGIDIMEGVGYRVIAVADGKVVVTGHNIAGGNRVIIYHGEDLDRRHLYSGYYHLHTILAEPDQTVKRGQPIGTIGRTGTNLQLLPPHLHYAVWVSLMGSYRVRDGRAYMDGARITDPNDFWLEMPTRKDGTRFIAPFVDGTLYAQWPVRFTYPVPCSRKTN